ncbi:MAG: putative molybdenum carrier protein [Gammaproteobacteria bacterium]|nr:putative molybdenum carrier protein [Gammaproteobacteria bacterium]
MLSNGGPGQVRAIRIVSGGQTGVDRGALDAALDLGVPAGGWCPRGRLAEDGPIPGRYPLREHRSAVYSRRTEQNVRDSDATVILHFGRLEGGTRLTAAYCRRFDKICLLLDMARLSQARAVDMLSDFVAGRSIHVLNVAGPRASNWPEAHRVSRAVIGAFLARRPSNAGGKGT